MVTMRKRGTVPVYIGDDHRRYFVPPEFLSHPLFKMLLEKAYEEYGFEQRGGLLIPCRVSVFQEVMNVVECSHGQFHLDNLINELN
ncbi:hypothetical protein J5N97_021359 [Dioscorea zingiberensis]|uniref:Small auxin up regulated protein n=1 Tax=Dioscorea zingiberensis TaxID=325984 RepID=A0A9D5CI27_9LILI|nr:hypothetical protein J5N97_021359 [Dioscorea zingiberensis]